MAKAQHRMEIQTYARDKVSCKFRNGRYELIFGTGKGSKFALLMTEDQVHELVKVFGLEQARIRISNRRNSEGA